MEREKKTATYSSRPILSFRTSRELLRKIDKQAEKYRKTRAEILAEIIEQHLTQIEV